MERRFLCIDFADNTVSVWMTNNKDIQRVAQVGDDNNKLRELELDVGLLQAFRASPSSFVAERALPAPVPGYPGGIDDLPI